MSQLTVCKSSLKGHINADILKKVLEDIAKKTGGRIGKYARGASGSDQTIGTLSGGSVSIGVLLDKSGAVKFTGDAENNRQAFNDLQKQIEAAYEKEAFEFKKRMFLQALQEEGVEIDEIEQMPSGNIRIAGRV